MYINYQLHVSANAAVAIIRLDTIYQKSYIDIQHITVISIGVGERKLRVFENMVLRRIFGPRRDEVTGEWRRLHNEELNDLYCSPILCG